MGWCSWYSGGGGEQRILDSNEGLPGQSRASIPLDQSARTARPWGWTGAMLRLRLVGDGRVEDRPVVLGILLAVVQRLGDARLGGCAGDRVQRQPLALDDARRVLRVAVAAHGADDHLRAIRLHQEA